MTNDEEDTVMDEFGKYEPTLREGWIAEALDIVAVVGSLTPLDNNDVAAFIEGYLQGKDLL